MKKIIILVEGPTEATFVDSILNNYLISENIILIPKIITTKKVKDVADFKGGIISYSKFKSQIIALLGDSSAVLVTTMIDYYGLPPDFPCTDTSLVGINKVKHLESMMRNDINNDRFLPYIQIHEFEALLFSSPEEIEIEMLEGKIDSSKSMQKIRTLYGTPEDINTTSPPGRKIEIKFPLYDKVLNGNRIANSVGVNQMISECPHFKEWIEFLKNTGR